MGILIDDFASGKNVTPLPDGVELGWYTKIKDLLPDEWELQDTIASENANLLDLFSHMTERLMDLCPAESRSISI